MTSLVQQRKGQASAVLAVCRARPNWQGVALSTEDDGLGTRPRFPITRRRVMVLV